MPIIRTWSREAFVDLFNRVTRAEEDVSDYICCNYTQIETDQGFKTYIIAQTVRAGGYVLEYAEPLGDSDVDTALENLMEYLRDNTDAVVVEGTIE